MLAMTFVMSSPAACIHQGTGLVAAHMYDFLSRIWPMFGGGRNWIKTPEWVHALFEGQGRRVETRQYGTAFATRGTAASPSQAGGQRLGGATPAGTSWTSAFSGLTGGQNRGGAEARRGLNNGIMITI
ncbi:hypothetical protein MRB53_037142 [Persea americana]|nr:hypothetical protein MRB53_037142 [Persea americana]